jgi:predicted CoA-substrate-specific enzyme activase
MKTAGICFGAASLQCVELQTDSELGISTIINAERIDHEGNPAKAFTAWLESSDIASIDRIAVTGRSFTRLVSLTSISEPVAVECAIQEAFAADRIPDIVVSLGGETQLIYVLSANGTISSVHSGNKCASGTGEFFLQQIRRMGMNLSEAVSLASEGEPYKIAGRCSVFCKSDCTHALNKGVPAGNVVAGLCNMMAEKIAEMIKDRNFGSIALTGGGSLNKALVNILSAKYRRVLVPRNSSVFEAWGAALWAAKNNCLPIPKNINGVLRKDRHSFGRHQPLSASLSLVDFCSSPEASPKDGDECALGLDVGSTTTKAALVRMSDRAMIASVYLRTNGNPVEASRACYKAILEQIQTVKNLKISGLGITGSGRQIAALHALSSDIINEIVAHATAAAFYDPAVDTIFEIGGQDAKYTFLTEKVPSDYAMNEACSAGTGSFLEEAAKESLNVPVQEIGQLALESVSPPNFTDQCAAFISSDIKRAGQEGVERSDILAGLVYSICMNYLNRVKGNRPVGRRILMQGGVCYNRAVPVAMASLLKTRIIVPPNPGLMGAFGVALEVCGRLERKETEIREFSLQELADRVIEREQPFICGGGAEKCDRKCEIFKYRINGKLYPFGGGCNKYYNLRFDKAVNTDELDLVMVRSRLMMDSFGPSRHMLNPQDNKKAAVKRVGINRSFLTHSLYPLFSNFFARLGFEVVLPDKIDPAGVSTANASFCYPAEISHGAFFNLLSQGCDFLFVPQVAITPVSEVPTYSKSCPVVQGEPYYLGSTVREKIKAGGAVVLSPVLKMQEGYKNACDAFVSMSQPLGVGQKECIEAFEYACEKQAAFEREIRRVGKNALYTLEKSKGMGIVLFGRPYNAFTADANMGIPHKLASRGYMVIPHDMLPAEHYKVDNKMFWAQGQKIMKAAGYVKDHKSLYGVYITNFSCGPDSFLIGYFRNRMEGKPSLTLELDQHTADAGIDTRIEAAIDIMTRHMGCIPEQPVRKTGTKYVPARVVVERIPYVYSSGNEKYALNDPMVEVIFPSMGSYHSQSAAAVMRGMGINARTVPIPDADVLITGRKNTSCKECLPYQVVVGSFLEYLKKKKDPQKVTLFFLATGGGPCRLGQYFRAFEQIIEKERMENVAVLTLTDENQYAGMGSKTLLKAWQGILCADVFGDIKSMLSVTAEDPDAAIQTLNSSWKEILAYLEGRLSVRFSMLLSWISQRLKAIRLKRNPADVPVISLVGEIFVRRDEFSRNGIVEYLENRGFMVKVAPVSEFMSYGNHIVSLKIAEMKFSFAQQIKMELTAKIQDWWENRVKSILALSGLYRFEMNDIPEVIDGVEHLINVEFRGECILTVGVAMKEIIKSSCGVLSIGPFGCMHARMAESVLRAEMTPHGKARMPGWSNKARLYGSMSEFPFLALETDGNPFPQIIEANLEAFVMQAERMHRLMQGHSKTRQTQDVVQLPQIASTIKSGIT